MSHPTLPSTEFPFILPRGLVDPGGNIHRHGIMRLATGKDEIYFQNDIRVRENPAYGIISLLSRLITRLGTLAPLTPELLEQLFLVDLVYLREFYLQLNQPEMEPIASGELSATPWIASTKR
ncbi:hypothetical protein [Phormidium sp. CCY1219]|uniref:hypothetical protein n=1 Tax=Phormidium sp. CCY1219 TaxID=2886104 RepID=UPI002D1EF011|nr:hypothetical protein [Phormidium sp. CCY1219]MEB3828414.1 hypothetical protein [Phormidium sp. CCY1219]